MEQAEEARQGYCDIHSHILPGVDDGARTMEEALQILEMARAEGIRILTATPHYSRSTTPEDAAKMRRTFRALKKEAQEKFPELVLAQGNEILYSYNMLEELESRRALTMGKGRYVLVEFPPAEEYDAVFHAFQSLLRSGYHPIAAHVERLECLWKKWERMDSLRAMGVLFQMNTQSLLGSFLSGPVRYCRSLVSQGYIAMLGTDAHSCGRRAPIYEEAASWVRKNCGEEMLRRISWSNPKAVLEGRRIGG